MGASSEFISINSANIADEHICCALGDKKHIAGVDEKKKLMAANFSNGYEFIRLNARGKVFADIIPAEYAFAPISADNYLFIQCLWVSGSFAGKGFARELINIIKTKAIEAEKDGIVIISSDKKRPFLSDKKFLTKMGFEVCDEAAPYFNLMTLKLNTEAANPQFNQSAKEQIVPDNGIVHFYSHWCPFNKYYAPMLEKLCIENGVMYSGFPIESLEDAKQSPSPFTINTLFYNGKFLTHEILSEKSFEKKVLHTTKL